MSWMQTYSGHKFSPFDPHDNNIYIEDIAAALSKLCRYGGHCRSFYSVAEHSILVAQFAPPAMKLTALMHDAQEAYLSDIPRPLKPHLVGYSEAEDRLYKRIAIRFNLIYPIPTEIARLDSAILRDEGLQALATMADGSKHWCLNYAGLGVKLKFLTPAQAMEEFMTTFRIYGGVA